MKKNLLTGIFSNLALIFLIGVLFFTCLNAPASVNAFKPIYKGEEKSGGVAIMINVYQGAEYVEKILDILAAEKATCTFFVGGVWAEKNCELLKKMSEQAEIGNHGYLHRDHKNIGEKENRDEIALCHKLVEKVLDRQMTLFAPPSGSYSDTTLSVAESMGYSVIMWTKDTIDWRDKDYELITKRAVSDIQSGDLVLMHPTEQTVKALPYILREYKRKNLVTMTVSEILSFDPNSY